MSNFHLFAEKLFLSLPLGAKTTPVHAGGVRLKAIDFGVENGGWHVPVPGWAWRGIKPGGNLKLRIGKSLIRKSAILHQATLVERLTLLAKTPHLDVPIFDLITALEHVHYAQGVFAVVPETVQSYLHEAAATTGLSDIIPGTAKVKPLIERNNANDPAVRQFVSEFGSALHTKGTANSLQLLREISGRTNLSHDQRRAVALDLTPHFCVSDEPEQLYAEVLNGDLSLIAPEDDANWQGSYCLPGRILEGDLTSARLILNDLIAHPSRWAATPAIGWSLRRLASTDMALVGKEERKEILTLGLRYVDALNGSYFGVSRCREMQRAVVCMIAQHRFFDSEFQTNLIWTALRSYGASPTFWHDLRDMGGPLPLELRAAERSFQALEDATATPQTDTLADEALKGLTRFGVSDAARIRHDLFGGFGVCNGSKLSLTRIACDTSTPRDAILRGLAAPLAPPLNDLTSDVLQDAIMQAYHHTPAAPFADLAGHAGAKARALIGAAAQDPTSAHDATIEALLNDLAILCTPAAAHRGVGLGLATLSDLADGPGAEATSAFAAGLTHLLKFAAQAPEAAFLQAPWPRAAAIRLAQRHSSRFDELCSVLPEFNGINLNQKSMPSQKPEWQHPTALNDTLVVVQSSRASLEDHVPSLRRGWLSKLAALGVPFLIATSRDNNSPSETPKLSVDVLELPYSDGLDDGPDRLLAVLDWVRQETDFAHVMLVDCETQLAVTPWFDQQNFRMSDYFGQLGTVWEKDGRRRSHQVSASGPHATYGFEKLPRDLAFADGRFSLTLSRKAMEQLSNVLASPEGQTFRHSGFAPDRLLAAALQLADIWPAGDGLYSAAFKAVRPGGISVPKGHDGFALPSSAPVSTGRPTTNLCEVTHGTPPPAPASAVLWPRKVWASHAPVRLGPFSNALHLISAEERLHVTPDVTVITVSRNERFILPNFLAHYRGLGVERFLIADNGSNDGSLEYLNEQPDVILFSAQSEFRHANQGTDWKVALMQKYCMNKWALVADADEFLVYPNYETQSLVHYLARYDGSSIDAVRILMLDMYPKGLLTDAKFNEGSPFDESGFADRSAFLYNSLGKGPYSNGPTVTSGLRHRMMPGSRPELFVCQKIPLFRYKPWMRFSVSMHYAADVNLASDDLAFAHFKYHADFRLKAEREVARGQYFNNAEEYRKYLALAAEGQDRLYDPAISIPWQDVAAIRAILGRQYQGKT